MATSTNPMLSAADLQARPAAVGAAVGRLRWAVNSTEWQPIGGTEGPEFKFLAGLIREDEDRRQVHKFHFDADRKRALLSRLLVRKASASVLGLHSFNDLEISRTKGKKPFLKWPRPADDELHLANFNFNVSHEGDWVVLASEPLCLCGVDVAAPADTRRGKINIREDFKDQLSSSEWAEVTEEASRQPSDGAEYEAFQRRWSCKEAFVKARGDGLGFEPLGRAAFSFKELEDAHVADTATGKGSIDAYRASVRVDGREEPQWTFIQHRLGSNHWVTVARGPTDAVVDAHGAFRRTLRRQTADFSTEAWRSELDAESPHFEELPVSELVPLVSLMEYGEVLAAAGGIRLPAAKMAKPVATCKECKGAALSRCSRCKDVSYCSATCQRASWPLHKARCHRANGAL